MVFAFYWQTCPTKHYRDITLQLIGEDYVHTQISTNNNNHIHKHTAKWTGTTYKGARDLTPQYSIRSRVVLNREFNAVPTAPLRTPRKDVTLIHWLTQISDPKRIQWLRANHSSSEWFIFDRLRRLRNPKRARPLFIDPSTARVSRTWLSCLLRRAVLGNNPRHESV